MGSDRNLVFDLINLFFDFYITCSGKPSNIWNQERSPGVQYSWGEGSTSQICQVYRLKKVQCILGSPTTDKNRYRRMKDRNRRMMDRNRRMMDRKKRMMGQE